MIAAGTEPTIDPAAATELSRLVGVMHALRQGCPWDAEQTHESLLHYLIEEACEVVDAVENGGPQDLCEELGDLLLQVMFHSEIASENGQYSIADVARGISDKLIRRHPYVFTDADVPADLMATWETRKRAEKQRTSALDGIPERLSALARAQKVVSRARSHGVDLELSTEPIEADQLGDALLELVARAQASGHDPEQAARAALRRLEARVVAVEN